MDYLLDTSALLAHYRNESGAQRVQELFTEEGAKIFIASVSIPEFARRLRDLGQNEEQVQLVLTDYRQALDGVITIDELVAESSVEMMQHIKVRLPLVDALISAAARVSGATLVHRDIHMSSIPIDLLPSLDLAQVV